MLLEVRRSITEAMSEVEAEIATLRTRLDELEGEHSSLGKALEAIPPVAAPDPDPRTEVIVIDHHGKYRRLWEYLRDAQSNRLELSFEEIESDILGFPLPPSSRKHLPHWYGYEGSAVARAIRDAGWKAKDVNLTAETVTFVRA